MIPKITELGQIVAERQLKLVLSNGVKQDAIIKIGMPFQFDDDGTWICPYELSGQDYNYKFGMVGIDSMQALQLTLKTLPSELERWARNDQGSFEYLGEPGAGLEDETA